MANLQSILLSLPAVIIAIGFHEAAHAFVAYELGDNTARNEGRLTINPMKHVDPVGLLMLIIFRFGWAKPVPINPNNFKNKKWGTVLTALAGPVTNLIIAFVTCFIYVTAPLYVRLESNFGTTYMIMLGAIITINVGLAIFNFIPIPPLDGSKIFSAILPDKYYYKVMQHQSMIQLIVILLLFSGIIGAIISPIADFFCTTFLSIATNIVISIVSLF